ncbi:two-component system regulatory protein YycI [Vagococcus acidifermentans]|uniref:Regulatory protein YycH-like domain-containing protein n=1 Tax=Vagococcus acidifermentans TaxID=564710 RepID=A0A430AWR8_9ENTE|nr:two-component system regulatory protein YycI [Vagococcus acidifermentans]RSU12498.1 hypothetical protein CBF27_05865 [Vagococcus acidifermentans]
MDFKKIEGIFLVAFLFLNIFLFSVYQDGKGDSDNLAANGVTTSIENRLKVDKIKLSRPLSEKKYTGYYLSAEQDSLIKAAEDDLLNQNWSVEKNRLTATFVGLPDQRLSKKDTVASLTQFIQKGHTVLHGQEYNYSKINSNTDEHQYVFVQEWEGLLFNDVTSQLVLEVKDAGNTSLSVAGYQQTYLKNIEPLREKQSLISEKEAIVSLYTNNRLPSASKIEWSQLAYTQMFTVRGKNVYIPAWFVAVTDDKDHVQIERVNAISGAVLTSNISEVKN